MAAQGAGTLELAGAAAAVLVAIAGCGAQGRAPTQAFQVSLPTVGFPARQHLAAPVTMRIEVRNDGRRTIPDVAVSVDSFLARGAASAQAGQPRPAWILDRTPRNVSGADGATWALGPLAPGATRRFLWQVTPVRPGRSTVRYRIETGLAGRAAAVLVDGRAAAGQIAVTIDGAPADARVDPATGRVTGRFSGAGAAG